MSFNNRIKINYKLDNITDALDKDIRRLVEKNINQKLDKYFEKFLSKKDAEIIIDVIVRKNKQGKYEGSFRFQVDGKLFIYKNDVPFKNINDLVNHAFDHLKQNLSK